MKWLYYQLFPGWEIIKVYNCTWTIIWDDIDLEETRHCHYSIFYSKGRKDYKLEIGGFKARDHHYYSRAVQNLNNFKKYGHE